jgi:hypothetical protein
MAVTDRCLRSSFLLKTLIGSRSHAEFDGLRDAKKPLRLVEILLIYMPQTQRSKAVDAVDVLNDLIIDLIAGVMVFRQYDASFKKAPTTDGIELSVNRLCLSHLILNLCKFIEFWKKYKNVVPNTLKEPCKSLVKALEGKKVTEFRNKYIGHIWDDELSRPLVHSEIIRKFEILCDGDLNKFMNWINNPKANSFPTTVISVIETTRDVLAAEYQIANHETVGR